MAFVTALSWELLAIVIVLLGDMVENKVITSIGAIMLLFTCAFAY